MKKHRTDSVSDWQKVCMSGILILFQTGATYAEESPAALDYIALQGITVTATRTEQDIFLTPESISIVNEKQIEREQATNLADIVEELPNVNIAGGPRSSGQRINIRGISDQRILYLIDGARQDFNRAHNSRTFLDPELLKQVEVVRGPTTLWGSGALGGVISLTTKNASDLLKPGERWGAKFKTGFQGVNEQWMGNTAIFGQVGHSVDYLFDFAYRNADNMRLGDGTDLQNSGFESFAGLAKLTWTPDPYQTAGFSVQTFDKREEVPSNPQVLASRRAPLVNRKNEQRNFTWRYNYENPEHPYIQPDIAVYYNSTDLQEIRKTDYQNDQTYFDTVGVNVRNVMQFEHAEQFSQTVSYGVDYYHNEAQGKRNGVQRTSFPDARSDVVGVYLQDEIKFWKKLTLIPGIRWDYFSNQANNSSLGKQQDDQVSFKVGLNFAVTDWLSIQASYNEAFRAPNLEELFVSGTHFTCGPGCANLFVPNPELKPEKAHNKEIGLRMNKDQLFFDADKARFRFSYFYNEVDNFIDTLVNFTFAPVPGNPGLGGTTSNQNVKDATLEGFELELDYSLPYSYVGAAYSQTRGKNNTTGEPLSNVLADKWTLQAGLRYPLWGLSLGWRGSIVSSQNRVPVGGVPTKGYVIHDLNLSWHPTTGQMSRLRVNLGIKNITNQDYRKHLSVLKEPGRNYMATVSWQF